MDIEDIIKKIEYTLAIRSIDKSALGSGQCNIIYLLESALGRKLCLKIEKEKRSLDEINHISVEGQLVEFLSRKKFLSGKIPQFLMRAENFYVYEYVKGDSLKKIYPELNKEKRELIFSHIAEFHVSFLGIHQSDISDINIKTYQFGNNKLNPENLNISCLSKNHQDFLKEIFNIYIDSQNDAVVGLAHNDAHGENIFIENEKVIFIDFGDTLFRDIHYDVYRYVFDYPVDWKFLVSQIEDKLNKKLNYQRIIAISLLRHLRGFLLDYSDNSEKIAECLNYYQNLFREYK